MSWSSSESLSSWRTTWTATLRPMIQRIAGGRLIARSCAPRSGPWRLIPSKGMRSPFDAEPIRFRAGRFRSSFGAALSDCPQPQPQRIQLDESLGIALIVRALVFLEGDVLHGIERLGRLAADHRGVALVELEPHRARDIFLTLVDQRLQHLALRRKPEAEIDQLGIFRHQLVLEMARAAIERDRLDAAMRGMQDRAARRLIDAATLHADEAVLHQVEAADAVGLAQLIEFGEQRRRRHLHT